MLLSFGGRPAVTGAAVLASPIFGEVGVSVSLAGWLSLR